MWLVELSCALFSYGLRGQGSFRDRLPRVDFEPATLRVPIVRDSSRLSRADYFFNPLHLHGHFGLQRRRISQRRVNPSEVIVYEIERQGLSMVLDLL